MRLHHIFGFLALSLKGVLGKMHKARLILDGYFNPLVFWYQWEYLRSPANNLSFFAGYLADWQGKFFRGISFHEEYRVNDNYLCS